MDNSPMAGRVEEELGALGRDFDTAAGGLLNQRKGRRTGADFDTPAAGLLNRRSTGFRHARQSALLNRQSALLNQQKLPLLDQRDLR